MSNILSVISEEDTVTENKKDRQIFGLATANEQIAVKYTLIVITLDATPTSQNNQ
jgi:hypothetical protein